MAASSAHAGALPLGPETAFTFPLRCSQRSRSLLAGVQTSFCPSPLHVAAKKMGIAYASSATGSPPPGAPYKYRSGNTTPGLTCFHCIRHDALLRLPRKDPAQNLRAPRAFGRVAAPHLPVPLVTAESNPGFAYPFQIASILPSLGSSPLFPCQHNPLRVVLAPFSSPPPTRARPPHSPFRR